MRVLRDGDGVIRGVPGELPENETIQWQGDPNAESLAIRVFRIKWVIGYFLRCSCRFD